MLKSKLFAKILERLINNVFCDRLQQEVKYKIYIHLDFSIEAKLFVDFPDDARLEFPIGNEGNVLQSYYEDAVKDYFAQYPENALGEEDNPIYIPEIMFEIEDYEESLTPLNRKLLSGKTIEFGAKYRLSSLLDKPIERSNRPVWGDIPVITFYSYKGGMGRTTTMVAFALYLAAKGKKVAILDCDLEAPGYLNFFNLSNQKELMLGKRNGLVEYLSDYSFTNYRAEYIDLSKYIIIPDSISQGGIEREYMNNIIIVPGGNLNDINEDIRMETEDKERLRESGKDYLEGLSRLNISNPFVTRDALGSLFAKLQNEREVDVILVDSRTGFNDIFGTIALSMSNHVVGFVGFSDQTMPGLRQLYRQYANENTNFGLDLVTNLIPQDANDEWLEAGKNKIARIWDAESQDCDKDVPGHYLLRRLSIFERLGTGDNNADARLVTLVEELLDDDKRRDVSEEIGEMGALFDHLITVSKLETEPSRGDIENDSIEISSDYDFDSDVALEIDLTNTPISEMSSFRMQKEILNYTKRKFADIHVFAEDTNIENSIFFYRRCMAEFFNPRKFIILGSKGSGKSMLYQALGKPEYASTAKLILDCAKKTSRRENFSFAIPDSEEIICLNTISLKRDLDFNSLLDTLTPSQLRVFWMVYSWNAIMTDPRFEKNERFRTEVLLNSNIADKVISTELENYQKAQAFSNLLNNDFGFYGNVESDIRRINSFLTDENKRLYILYDGLDNINPRTWSKNISPLVDFWRDRTDKYSNITPKLFIRTDLFAYIEGTNTLRLKEASINIDWTLEEVFGYFFKIVLSNNRIKELFWNILEKLDKGVHIHTFQNSWDDEAGQLLSPTPAVLGPLVKIYFGEKISQMKNTSSWTFFKTSLSNANQGISLRPFINLLSEEVINRAIQDPDRHVKAILPSKYYATQDNRDKAANDNFEDMAKGDDFTADILKFREFLRSSNGDRYRYQELDELEFENLLGDIIAEYGHENLISRNKADLRNQLIAAGIVAIVPRGRKYYRFASMYYYTWGLAKPENWERGVLRYGRNGRLVVEAQDGRRYSFRGFNEPRNSEIGTRIEFKRIETTQGNFRVDAWRLNTRR